MRKITVVSTTTDVFEIETAASTLGQLLNDSGFSGRISSSNMRFRVRGDSNNVAQTLENTDATLPSGAFVLFISPLKVKSGI